MNNGNTRPPALSAGEAPDEKLKINELGPNMHIPMSSEVGFGCEIQLQFSRARPSTLAPAHARTYTLKYIKRRCTRENESAADSEASR